MIDGTRRGYMSGYELEPLACLLPDALLSDLARQVYASLQMQGYAHLDPMDGFIQSFTDGWSAHRSAELSIL